MADKFLTHTAEQVDSAIDDINTHKANTNNPHSVTAAQVGLGNVDNTSDADKPVSTAVGLALADKVDKIAGKGLSTNDYTDEEKSKVGNAQPALTESQLAAVNSGANSTNIAQIATNTSDIADLKKKSTIVYGFHVNPNESDPFDAVTYLLDAKGMTPAKMGENAFNPGSWGDAWFIPKPCMVKSDGTVDYYLNPNDYSKKVDGTASDVSDVNYDGNAMLEWPLIWYKVEEGSEDGEWSFFISPVQIDEDYVCYSNYDSKDHIIPHFYTAIYNGTGTTKLRSISGVKLTSANGNGSTTVNQEVAHATENNTTSDVEWYTSVWADEFLFFALCYLISKSLDLQSSFGQGISARVSGSTYASDQALKEDYETGTLNDKGLFWGDTNPTTGTETAVKVFGRENPWGCVFNRVAGFMNVSYDCKVKMTYGKADGSTAIGYNQTGNGYIANGVLPNSNGYVKAMRGSKYGLIPKTIVSSAPSTYYCDYYYQNNISNGYLRLGGRAGTGSACGFYVGVHGAPSVSHWAIAAALSLKPLLK